MNWFKVSFGSDGLVTRCEPCRAPPDFIRDAVARRTYYIQAAGPLQAEERAREHYNLYCAKKRKTVRARNHAAGKCICGRMQDRVKPDGSFYLTCEVCKVRHDMTEARAHNRRVGAVPGVRDDVARVQACTARVRDRKNEMRLEVLLEVSRQWENARNNQVFTRWLRGEVAKALAPRAPTDTALAPSPPPSPDQSTTPRQRP